MFKNPRFLTESYVSVGAASELQRIARDFLLLGKSVPRLIFGGALLDARYENGKF